MVIVMTSCTDNKASLSFEEVQWLARQEISANRLMLGDDWDMNDLPEVTWMVANAQQLYDRDNGQEIPTVDVSNSEFDVDKGVEIDVLIPAITKYYPFDNKMLRSHLEQSPVYDVQTGAVVLADGWGWHLDAVVHNVTDNQDGTYDIAYGLYNPQNEAEYTGVVKAQIHADGHMQFVSNTVKSAS